MAKTPIGSLALLLAASSGLHANLVILENTIPSGNLLFQPPSLTGAAPVFGPVGGGVVLADGFTAPTTATLNQISVVVEYEDFSSLGVTGRSSMLLSLFSDSNNSPGLLIENWTVALSPTDTNLTIVTVISAINPLLVSGKQYWLSEVPTDPVHTGIGWGLVSSLIPGIQLPIAESTTGTNSSWQTTVTSTANEFSVIGSTAPEATSGTMCAIALLSITVCLSLKKNNTLGVD
jgi:hypothetical protein